MVDHEKKTSEWTLWVVAVSCALHVTEEYLTNWQQWGRENLGIDIPDSIFISANVVLVIAALSLARFGWSKPSLTLVIPSATLVNAIFFHILPTIVQRRVSPGVYTSVLLYLPFSSWAIIGAARDGVRRSKILVAFVCGTIMMLGAVLAAMLLTRQGR